MLRCKYAHLFFCHEKIICFENCILGIYLRQFDSAVAIVKKVFKIAELFNFQYVESKCLLFRL